MEKDDNGMSTFFKNFYKRINGNLTLSTRVALSACNSAISDFKLTTSLPWETFSDEFFKSKQNHNIVISLRDDTLQNLYISVVKDINSNYQVFWHV